MKIGIFLEARKVEGLGEKGTVNRGDLHQKGVTCISI